MSRFKATLFLFRTMLTLNANQIFSYQQILQYKHIRVQFETDQFFYDPQKAKLIDI